MGPLGDGSDPAPGEEGEPVPGALDLEDGGEAGFESDLFQAGAELTTDCANDLVSTVMEVFATVQLRDPAKAAICAERVRMKAAREARIRATIARWAEKNPQKAAKFFGALLLWDPAMWLGDVTKQFSAVAAAGSKLRENTAPALTTSGAPAATATPIAAVIPTPAMIPKPLKAEDFTA